MTKYNNTKDIMQTIIEIKNGIARNPAYRLAEPINLSIQTGEQVAIVGSNGSGKSLLIDTITGKYPLLLNEVQYDFSPSSSNTAYDNIKYITFRDSYGEADSNYYYQQRWNSQDADSTPTVSEALPKISDSQLRDRLYALFHLETILNKRMLLLSSGEMRKFQLTRALLSGPRVLILDNPFIGLDAQTRNLLRDLLQQLTEETNLQLILVLSKTDDIPSFITHIIPVENKICQSKITRESYLHNQEKLSAHVLNENKKLQIINLPEKTGQYFSEQIIDLQQVSIRYGERTILKDLNWTVKNGEHWALSGENGAGKSTLLSLICADNPQSYACNISLFGRKRGSGESIWEIKKHIGYVSPEMHRAYMKNLPALAIVASGLHDSIGLYKQMKTEDEQICSWWMDIFGIASLKERNFLQLSSGEQRLVLLARAFVKDPELLILDEPLHGLDLYNRRMVKDIIEAFCQRANKTLVMVTHYQEELPNIIDHHLLLKKNI